jgi:hypothetical protein
LAGPEQGHKKHSVMHKNEIAAAADQFRRLNERQAREGIERLRVDLADMQEKGILGPDGRRIGEDSPAEILDQAYDDV